MGRDLASLEMELGKLGFELDDETGKVFDKIDAVRQKAPGVFKRTHARVDAKAATVDRVDALLTRLDRANDTNPTSDGSSSGSASSSQSAVPPPPDSAEKKS